MLADAYPVEEPAANLVARSRLRLEDALDALPPKTWLERFAQRLNNNFASLQAAPVAACLLLLIGGGAGASQRLDRLDAQVAEVGSTLGRAECRVSELEALSRTDISRVGFVRYDAFDDSGAELSYALALLNRDGDGVVISSIYSRADTRTFGKGVQGFKPAVNASEEELRAIERARTTNE